MEKNILTKELLLRSVEEWNKAREDNPDSTPDLIGADLRDADLREANLFNADLRGAIISETGLVDAHFEYANLSGAELHEANLSGANFHEANLSGADLSDACLQDANLHSANLSRSLLDEATLWWTDLTEANLTDADLSGATLGEATFQGANLSGTNLCAAFINGVNFTRANLSRTNFSGAKVHSTIFADVDLSGAIGLDTIKHEGPSTIGIDTIYKSNGSMPEVFLRGCGVPDTFIEYARSLTNSGIEYYSCFISYSHKNEEFAQRLHTDLQANNVRCWFAPHDLPIGAKTRPAIDDAIRIHDKLLLILSEHSVDSNWVEHEVEHALDLETERGKLVLFPVRLDDAVMDSKTGWASNVKRQRNIGDFTKWKDHDSYQKAFNRLLKDLKQ